QQPLNTALLENARLDLPMTDGAEKDRFELPQLPHSAVGQHFASLEKTVAAEVVLLKAKLETEPGRRRRADLQGLACDFGPGAVAWNDRDVVALHGASLFARQPCGSGRRDARASGRTGNGILMI